MHFKQIPISDFPCMHTYWFSFTFQTPIVTDEVIPDINLVLCNLITSGSIHHDNAWKLPVTRYTELRRGWEQNAISVFAL